MKKILRAVVLAALCIALGIMIRLWFKPDDAVIEITVPTPTATVVKPVPITTIEPTQTPSSDATPPLDETPIPQVSSGQHVNEVFCTLTIKGQKIKVLYGVDEATLKKHPGWLESSAVPGQKGMCVIYGHRNRTHFRILEKAETGDTITITLADGAVFTYRVNEITIYESSDDFHLPAVEGKALALVTCYPFRYSGHAPGKCVVTATVST